MVGTHAPSPSYITPKVRNAKIMTANALINDVSFSGTKFAQKDSLGGSDCNLLSDKRRKNMPTQKKTLQERHVWD
jgi:hypothetical protein